MFYTARALTRDVVDLLTRTCAIVASVGRPPGIIRAGADAWTTPSVQARQAYFGRRVTITRNCAAMRAVHAYSWLPRPAPAYPIFASVALLTEGEPGTTILLGDWIALKSKLSGLFGRLFYLS